MLKKLYLDIHKNYFIKKLKLFIKSYGVGSYLNSKVKGTKEEYLKLYEECLKNPNRIDNFIKANFTSGEENFINNLALLTQITKKSTELNFNHGFLLHECLKKYLSNSNEKKIYIVETGTARGFSSIVMSYLLSKYDIEYEIHTIDILPHKTKMYWNCINDPINGKVSREELLTNYKKYLKNIHFHEGQSIDVLKNLKLDRVHFAFLDGEHDYSDIKHEYEYVKDRNLKNDIIFCDDYIHGRFDGIVKFINEIKNQNLYKVDILDSNSDRGYAILERN